MNQASSASGALLAVPGDTAPFVSRLRLQVDEFWQRIRAGAFWRRVMGAKVSVELYRDLMLQVYHYTRHGPATLAATAFVPAPDGLLSVILQRAGRDREHIGMVVDDLRSAGLLRDGDLWRAPLPATDALVDYLYGVAMRHGPVARLGYSFWVEDVRPRMGDALSKVAQDLSLEQRMLSFARRMITTPDDSLAQVIDAIRRYAPYAEDQAQIERVALASMSIFGLVLDQLAERHPAPARP